MNEEKLKELIKERIAQSGMMDMLIIVALRCFTLGHDWRDSPDGKRCYACGAYPAPSGTSAANRQFPQKLG